MILVIEDNSEEQEKAKEVVSGSGHKPVVATTLKDAFRIWDILEDQIVGVITDMMFPDAHFKFDMGPHACGLSVIARAVRKDTPIVVCSNLNHHGVVHLSVVISALSEHPNYTHGIIPFIQDSKDWNIATADLLSIINQRG